MAFFLFTVAGKQIIKRQFFPKRQERIIAERTGFNKSIAKFRKILGNISREFDESTFHRLVNKNN